MTPTLLPVRALAARAQGKGRAVWSWQVQHAPGGG